MCCHLTKRQFLDNIFAFPFSLVIHLLFYNLTLVSTSIASPSTKSWQSACNVLLLMHGLFYMATPTSTAPSLSASLKSDGVSISRFYTASSRHAHLWLSRLLLTLEQIALHPYSIGPIPAPARLLPLHHQLDPATCPSQAHL
jgi:hypothetical protein